AGGCTHPLRHARLRESSRFRAGMADHHRRTEGLGLHRPARTPLQEELRTMRMHRFSLTRLAWRRRRAESAARRTRVLLRARKGMTLIELMVAVMLISVGLVTLAGVAGGVSTMMRG